MKTFERPLFLILRIAPLVLAGNHTLFLPRAFSQTKPSVVHYPLETKRHKVFNSTIELESIEKSSKSAAKALNSLRPFQMSSQKFSKTEKTAPLILKDTSRPMPSFSFPDRSLISQNQILEYSKKINQETKVQEHFEIKERAFDSLSVPEELYIRALIELEVHKNIPFALGAFALLSSDKKVGADAQLQYALSALRSKLYQEATLSFLELSQKKPELKPSIVKLLSSQDLVWPKTFLPRAIHLFSETSVGMGPKLKISLAKYFLEKGDLNRANDLLSGNEPGKTTIDQDVSYLTALLHYRRGQIKEAIEVLLNIPDDKRTDASHVLLARLFFQTSKYNLAVENYRRVSQQSPEYLDVLIELGWSQLLGGEIRNAIGNMTLLQNDIFSKAISPDSHLVAASGYLNLCQYGDGLRSLLDLEKKYKPQYASLIEVSKDGSYSPRADLENLRSSRPVILPPNILVELARSSNFKELESDIQILENEDKKFAGIILEVLKQEKLAAEAANPDPNEIKTLRQSRKLLAAARRKQSKRLRSEIAQLKGMQDLQLKQELVALRSDLQLKLKDTEKLKYEIFAGAGDQIRQLLGGKELTSENFAELSAQKVQWKFKNEIWMDEIGSFQSEIANACPSEVRGVSSTASTPDSNQGEKP